MKTFKILALLAAFSAAAVTVPAYAIKTCNQDGTCQSPNGPSLDGYAAASLSAASPNSIEMYSAPSKSCAIRNTCDLMDPVQLDAESGDGEDAGQQLPEPGRY